MNCVAAADSSPDIQYGVLESSMHAMVLAAGRGSRLGALTGTVPKCLVEVAGVPMLGRVFAWLMQAGVTEVVVNLHHLADQVRDWVEHRWSIPPEFEAQGRTLHVRFSYEDSLLGTGGGVHKARALFSDAEELFVVNADILCGFELENLRSTLQGKSALGVLLTAERKDSSYLLFDETHHLVGYEGSSGTQNIIPTLGAKSIVRRRGFCGVQLLRSKVFQFMEGFPPEFSLIDVYMKALRAGEVLIEADIGQEIWADIGTPQGLAHAQTLLGQSR